MKPLITDFFQGLKPLEISELLFFTSTLLLLPWNWSISLLLLLILAANAMIRTCMGRRIGNPHLSKKARWSLWILIFFYLYQVFTLVYTSNLHDGLIVLWRRLPMLLLPLGCLLVDTSFFKHTQKRTIMWLFTASLVLKFLVRFIVMLATKHTIVPSSDFDPIHHSYMALYVLMVIGFMYCEYHYYKKSLKPLNYCLIALVTLLMVFYLVMIQSRTGIAGIVLMIIAILIHQLFCEKNLRLGLSLLFATLMIGTAIFFLLPESQRRLTKTLTEASQHDTSDARFSINHGAIIATTDNLPLGVGIGDGHETLMQAFETIGYNYGIESQYNTHNSYLDAALTMGIPGLLILLILLFLPAWWALREENLTLLTFLFTVVLGALFEAILNRQMGILYFGLFYVMLIPSLGHCNACEPAPHKD